MFDRVVHILSSDAFLACLIPLALFLISLQLVERPSLSELRDILSAILYGKRAAPSFFSVQRAVLSYEQHARLSEKELAAMRSSYGKLSRVHKRIGDELGYPSKLDRLQEAILSNAKVTRGIADLALKEFATPLQDPSYSGSGSQGDLGRVKESLKHFVRDWSEEGREERARIFGPILDVLSEVEPERRAAMRVLVPGCGLGRLAWEISELGFETTANELSFFMVLAFRFLLSEETTQRPNQHVLRPYASWFSHQRTNDTLFRHVAFPDVVPRLSSRLSLAECDFLSLRAPSPLPLSLQLGDEPRGYDFIVTLFFLDTSLNAIQTIEHIYAQLRPGGTWVNLGPLLWTGGGQAAVELSLEEVLRLVRMVGFRLNEDESGVRRRRTVECEYTADREAMMRWIYQAEFWVATKMGH